MLKIQNFSTFPQGLVLWKCQDCRNCGNPRGIPTISWKTQRVFHNPLEKLKNSFSTFTQYFFLFLPLVFLFTERLVFLFTTVCVKLLTERLVFLLDFYNVLPWLSPPFIQRSLLSSCAIIWSFRISLMRTSKFKSRFNNTFTTSGFQMAIAGLSGFWYLNQSEQRDTEIKNMPAEQNSGGGGVEREMIEFAFIRQDAAKRVMKKLWKSYLYPTASFNFMIFDSLSGTSKLFTSFSCPSPR